MSVCYAGNKNHHHHDRNHQDAVTPKTADTVVNTAQRGEHVQAECGVVVGDEVAHVVAGEDGAEVHPESEELRDAAIDNLVGFSRVNTVEIDLTFEGAYRVQEQRHTHRQHQVKHGGADGQHLQTVVFQD